MDRLNIILVLACILTTNVFADSKDYYFQKSLQTKQDLKQKLPELKAINFKQLIDHSNPNLGTFTQRYYVDETYGSEWNSPTFLYICGEATCSASSIQRGAIREYAKKFKARLIAIEHRYYGHSQPFNLLTTENLKYLSTDQALQDLAYIQTDLTSRKSWQARWVVFGGSYAGSLAAYYRQKYPNLVVGALASSGPVMADDNFDEYDAHMARVAGEQCRDNMRLVVDEIEGALESPALLNSIKSKFQATTIKDNVDFLYLVADIGAIAIQYGMKEHFCGLLANETTPLKGYVKFAKEIYRDWQLDPVSITAQGAEDKDPDAYLGNFGMRQWLYQSCTEYGYWQNAHPDQEKSTRSSLIDAAYHQGICTRLFGIETPVDTNHINNNFYKPLLNARTTKIFFTNGSTDPWINLSIADYNDNTTNRNLDYVTIKGAAHCDDLRSSSMTDSASLRQARAKTSDLIQEWLN